MTLLSTFISIIGVSGSIIALIVVSAVLIIGNIVFGAYTFKQKKKSEAEAMKILIEAKNESSVKEEENIQEDNNVKDVPIEESKTDGIEEQSQDEPQTEENIVEVNVEETIQKESIADEFQEEPKEDVTFEK